MSYIKYKSEVRTQAEIRARPVTKADIAARIKHRENAEIVSREIADKFGAATAENVSAILEYQERRLKELQ
jgi:hypothetical protein